MASRDTAGLWRARAIGSLRRAMLLLAASAWCMMAVGVVGLIVTERSGPALALFSSGAVLFAVGAWRVVFRYPRIARLLSTSLAQRVLRVAVVTATATTALALGAALIRLLGGSFFVVLTAALCVIAGLIILAACCSTMAQIARSLEESDPPPLPADTPRRILGLGTIGILVLLTYGGVGAWELRNQGGGTTDQAMLVAWTSMAGVFALTVVLVQIRALVRPGTTGPRITGRGLLVSALVSLPVLAVAHIAVTFAMVFGTDASFLFAWWADSSARTTGLLGAFVAPPIGAWLLQRRWRFREARSPVVSRRVLARAD